MERRHNYEYPSDGSDDGYLYNSDEQYISSENEESLSSSDSDQQLENRTFRRRTEISPEELLFKQIKSFKKQVKELRKIRQRTTDQVEIDLLNEEIDYFEEEIRKMNEELGRLEEEFLAQYE